MKHSGIIVTGVILSFLLYGFITYKGLVSAGQDIAGRTAVIEAQLQHRAELVSGLVTAAGRFTGHEDPALGQADRAGRKAAAASGLAGRAEADEELTAALKNLSALAGRIPQLSSDSAWNGLMNELSGTEQLIAAAVKERNEIVRIYNTALLTFPGNLMAGPAGFAPAEFFRAAPGTEKALSPGVRP